MIVAGHAATTGPYLQPALAVTQSAVKRQYRACRRYHVVGLQQSRFRIRITSVLICGRYLQGVRHQITADTSWLAIERLRIRVAVAITTRHRERFALGADGAFWVIRSALLLRISPVLAGRTVTLHRATVNRIAVEDALQVSEEVRNGNPSGR